MKTQENMQGGQELRRWMADDGLKQATLAELLGCDQSKVSRILNGRTSLTVTEAFRIEKLSKGAVRAYAFADPRWRPDFANFPNNIAGRG